MVDPTNPIEPHGGIARPDLHPSTHKDHEAGTRGLIVDPQSAVTIEELIARLTPTNPDQIAPIIRAAFVGRTSTDDNQDPTLSIPRQVATCQAKLAGLPIQVVIVAYYCDIETGRLDLDQRGHGTSHEKFNIPVPRDGGITDLLTAAASPDRVFDVVIAEQISRTARDTRASMEFEHRLKQHDIQLWCATEPIDITTGDPAATTTLVRGMNRAIADWYVRNLLEQSRGGTEQHIKAGYNIGKMNPGFCAHPPS